MAWALRCSSIDELDFFAASVVRVGSGEIEVRGSERRVYAPDEIWFIAPSGVDRARALVEDVEAELRAIPRGDDIAFTFARDKVSVHLAEASEPLLKIFGITGPDYVEMLGV